MLRGLGGRRVVNSAGMATTSKWGGVVPTGAGSGSEGTGVVVSGVEVLRGKCVLGDDGWNGDAWDLRMGSGDEVVYTSFARRLK